MPETQQCDSVVNALLVTMDDDYESVLLIVRECYGKTDTL